MNAAALVLDVIRANIYLIVGYANPVQIARRILGKQWGTLESL